LVDTYRYALMMRCWHESVSRRPTFSILKQQLTAIFERMAVDHVYIDELSDNVSEIISSQPAGEKC